MTRVAEAVKPTLCEFESGGVLCRGLFYQPDAEPPYPCVVMAHGFGAGPTGPLGVVARHLVATGIAAFAFDFRHFGASGGEPRQIVNIAHQLEDWHAAIEHVRGRNDVDPARLGLWGSSLTGGHILAIAARDHEIAAAVSQVPYCDGFSLARAAGIRHNLRLLPAVVRDLLRALGGRQPYLIAGLGPPGARASLSTKFSDLYIDVIERVPAWRNQVAARSVLQVYRFRPIVLADQIRCPLLVVLSYEDRVAPPGPALRTAQRLPYVELALFHVRHFDLYTGEARERALHTEATFLAHQLCRPQAAEYSEDVQTA